MESNKRKHPTGTYDMITQQIPNSNETCFLPVEQVADMYYSKSPCSCAMDNIVHVGG